MSKNNKYYTFSKNISNDTIMIHAKKNIFYWVLNLYREKNEAHDNIYIEHTTLLVISIESILQ